MHNTQKLYHIIHYYLYLHIFYFPVIPTLNLTYYFISLLQTIFYTPYSFRNIFAHQFISLYSYLFAIRKTVQYYYKTIIDFTYVETRLISINLKLNVK